MEEKAKKPAMSGARPWQGTLLGVLNIIGAILLGLATLGFGYVLLTGAALFSGMGAEGADVAGFFGSLGGILVVPLLLLTVLMIFLARGMFKGQKWAVIVMIVLTALSILGSLMDFTNQIGNIIFNALIMWAEVLCLKHPFYNKK